MPLTDECIEHKGCCLPNGYGKLGRNGKTWLAHRWAWTQAFGDIPEGMHVCHKCDNRRCINPAHLFLGTRQDNMRDMIAKGRQDFSHLYGVRGVQPPPVLGERNAKAKLTADAVRRIRDEYASGRKSTVVLAAEYGVKPWTISRVIHKETWRHVDI